MNKNLKALAIIVLLSAMFMGVSVVYFADKGYIDVRFLSDSNDCSEGTSTENNQVVTTPVTSGSGHSADDMLWGKPVIYLYPEEEQDILVKVKLKGGFTETIPAYNDGWLVRADSESNIYNYADGEVYPYLFWEGRAYDIEMGDKGFVVAREDVRKFFIDSLSKLGLIQKEYDEFIGFWLPKMQENNYYFISFLSQEEFNQEAPLTIEPKPDTVIRVMMMYQGLEEKVEVAPQELSAPDRNGFTVVEWGGVLRN